MLALSPRVAIAVLIDGEEISATAADTVKTRIATDYLRLANGNYMPPPDGTTYKAVTGVVSTDLGGIVRPRDANDFLTM